MKRWLVGALLVALAGVLLVIVINSNRDPVAVLEGHGGKIERNEQGEVVAVYLYDTKITDAGMVHPQGRPPVGRQALPPTPSLPRPTCRQVS